MFLLLRNQRDNNMFDLCTRNMNGVEVWATVSPDFIDYADIFKYVSKADRDEEELPGGYPKSLEVECQMVKED